MNIFHGDKYMAKKSFKDNPALRFISSPEETPTPAQAVPEHAAGIPAPIPGSLVSGTANPGVIAPAAASVPMKPNPLYIETKSRRLNLLVQPSLHDRIKKIAQARGSSVNDLIHQILSDYCESQGA